MKDDKLVKSLFKILILFTMLSALTTNWLGDISKNGYDVLLKAKNMNYKNQEMLITKVVKKQQELISSQIRESLLNYIKINKVSISNNDGWNKKELSTALNVIVEPIKVFGRNGGIIVFDSNNGEIFLDTTPIKRTGKMHDDKFSKNQIEELLEKKDTILEDSIIYLAHEKEMTKEEAMDFKANPIGQHKRQFIEKAILPFESFGFGFSEDKQLTILVVADERDVFNSFIEDSNKFNEEMERLELNARKYIYFSIFALIASACLSIAALCKIKKIR